MCAIGICKNKDAIKVSNKEWDNVISVNLNSMFYLCREFGKVFIKQKYGSIVNVGSNSGIIVDTSNGILVKESEEDEHMDEHMDEHNHDSGDPHIWLNPVYAKIQVQNIADAFSKHDPENQQYYQSNAESYIQELTLLDSEIRNDLSTCNSDFIAFHDAFSYFADEYGLHQHTILSSSDPHGEATAKTLENVISTAKKHDIKIIFSEETVDSRTSETIAHEIGGKVLVLSPLEVASEGTYISKMKQNLENLQEALC